MMPDVAVHERPKQTERAFQAQVVRYAELMRWRWWHDGATNQRARCRRCHAALRCAECRELVRIVRNAEGFPDLVLVRRPRLVFAELKADRTPVTAAQQEWIALLRACDLEAYIWRPKHWPDIERLLR